MITRPNPISHHQRTRQQQTISAPKSSITRTASRPDTPPRSRGDLPSRHSSSSLHHPTSRFMPDQPVTPTPKKPDRWKRSGAPSSVQRDQPQDDTAHPADLNGSEEDEEILFDLLGVTSPAPRSYQPRLERGVLPVSKDDRETAQGRRGARRKSHQVADSEPDSRGKGRRDVLRVESGPGSPSPRDQARPRKLPASRREERGAISEGEALQPAKPERQRRNKALPMDSQSGKVDLVASTSTLPAKPSGISATRPKTRSSVQRSVEVTPVTDSGGTFDLSALSRSLPADGFLAPSPRLAGKARHGKKGAKSEDESAVWEMPDPVGPSAGQELTVSLTSIIAPDILTLCSGSRNCKTPRPTPFSEAPNPPPRTANPKPVPSPKLCLFTHPHFIRVPTIPAVYPSTTFPPPAPSQPLTPPSPITRA